MPSDCTARALKLLSGRSHFRRQLEAKLVSRGFAAERVEATLDRLTELGYLDDVRTATEFIASRLRRGPMGRRRMLAELERRGADHAAAETALEEAYATRSDLDGAREAAERWVSRQPQRSDSLNAEALARRLDRLGFETSSILTVVREVRSSTEAESDS